MRARTGNAGSPFALCAGRRKRRHCGWLKRFLDLIKISASSQLIGRSNLQRGSASHGIYRMAAVRVVVAIFQPCE